jgi:hypothetical protein
MKKTKTFFTTVVHILEVFMIRIVYETCNEIQNLFLGNA